jgi:hypothetical protein
LNLSAYFIFYLVALSEVWRIGLDEARELQRESEARNGMSWNRTGLVGGERMEKRRREILSKMMLCNRSGLIEVKWENGDVGYVRVLGSGG